MMYAISYSLISGNIYAGRVSKSGATFTSKEELSIPAALAVAEWVHRQHDGEVDISRRDGLGPTWRITVERIEPQPVNREDHP